MKLFEFNFTIMQLNIHSMYTTNIAYKIYQRLRCISLSKSTNCTV